MFNGKYIFQGSIFHCHVSLPECNIKQKGFHTFSSSVAQILHVLLQIKIWMLPICHPFFFGQRKIPFGNSHMGWGRKKKTPKTDLVNASPKSARRMSWKVTFAVRGLVSCRWDWDRCWAQDPWLTFHTGWLIGILTLAYSTLQGTITYIWGSSGNHRLKSADW